MSLKKICVVTWVDGINYGTVLQAYALTKYLQSLGYEIDFLKTINSKSYYIKYPNVVIDRLIFRFVNRTEYVENINDREFIRKQKKVFDRFRQEKFNFVEINNYSELCNFEKKYVAVIVGSDQLWNPYHYHPMYFLNFVKRTKKIAYSPSLGVSHLSNRIKLKYKKYLKDFTAIGVREKQGAKLLQPIASIPIKTNIDPVMLLDNSEWNELVNESNYDIPKKPYMLFYLVEDNSYYIEYIKRVYLIYNVCVVLIPMHKMDVKLEYLKIEKNVSPDGFLKLISNAEIVFTDSFHASCFSILFKREFYILKRFKDENPKSENSKIYNLLSEFGLEDRLIESDFNIMKNIDYDSLGDKLSELRKKSYVFINNAIGKESEIV